MGFNSQDPSVGLGLLFTLRNDVVLTYITLSCHINRGRAPRSMTAYKGTNAAVSSRKPNTKSK